MTTRFETLFSLEVRHDYYGGACGDVGFVVPGDVARLMRGAELVSRTLGGVLHVFYRASDTGAPLRSAAGKTVRVGLQVRSPSFANITEGFDLAAGALYYWNGTTVGALDEPARAVLGGHVFSWPLARSTRPVTVTVEDEAGNVLRTEAVPEEDGRTEVSFDLTGLEPGALKVKESYGGTTPRRTTTAYLLEPELWREGVFGVVELTITPSFYKNPPAFTVPFQARLDTLRYYVVTRGFSNGDVDLLSVRELGSGETENPGEVKFEKVLPEGLAEDEKARTELLGRDGARVLLFRSLSAVTRRQTGRKPLQLLRGTEPLIENLPQPGRDRGTADLVVQLSKSKA